MKKGVLSNLFRGLLVASMVLGAGVSSLLAQDMTTMVQTLMDVDEPTRRSYLRKIVRNYGEYQTVVKGASANRRITSNAWRVHDFLNGEIKELSSDVIRQTGTKPTKLVLVGSHGSGRGYTPGRSDLDFMPTGPDAKRFSGEFNTAFKNKFGVSPESCQINMLDPTDVSSWPKRIAAVKEYEKYNTTGGNKWLERKLWKDNTRVWNVGASGKIDEVDFQRMMPEPPSLVVDDAAGLFSDNTRFLNNYKHLDANDRILAEAKYHTRNAEAYELVTKNLSQDEDRLLKIARAIEGNKDPKVVTAQMKELGEWLGMSADDAARHYVTAMEALNDKMGREIIENHIKLISNSKTPTLLTEELAGVLHNLPDDMVAKYRTQVLKSKNFQGPRIWSEAMEMAQSSTGRQLVSESAELMAKKLYKKPFHQLGASQKRAVMEGMEGATALRWRVFKATGNVAVLGLTLHSLYDAGVAGYKEGGAKLAAGHVTGRLLIELLQMGCPPAAAVEIIGRLTAAGCGLAISAFKNDQLEQIYEHYRNDPEHLDDVLNDAYGRKGFSSALRVFATEMREQYKGITDAEILERIKNWMIRRKQQEDYENKYKRWEPIFESMFNKYGISIVPGGMEHENARLKQKDPEEYRRRIAHLLQTYEQFVAMLERDGIPFAEQNAMRLLIAYLRDAKLFEKLLSEMYEKAKQKPPSEWLSPEKRWKVVAAKGTKVTQTKPVPGKGVKLGLLTAVSGGWEAQEALDPADKYGPFTVDGPGRLVAEITGTPDVKNVWSLGNWNSSMHISFEPLYDQGYGSAATILTLSGGPGDNKLKGTGIWGSAGRITVYCGPAGGSAPLSGSQFAQSYSGTVTVTSALNEDQAAYAGLILYDGTRVVNDRASECMINHYQSSLWLGPRVDATLNLASDKPNAPSRWQLDSGRVRVKDSGPSPGPEWTLQLKGQTPDKLGSRFNIIPLGTEYELENPGESAIVRVFEGSVAVEDETGNFQQVDAGQQIQFPDGQPEPITNPPPVPVQQGVPFDKWQLDESPAPALTSAAIGHDGKLSDDWTWQDPDDDAKLEVTGDDTLMVTVPPNNNFWGHLSNSPRLLRKVSGDFMIECDLEVETEATEFAIVDWVIYSPGSSLGLLAKQCQSGDAANYRLLGGGWQVRHGQQFLPLAQRDKEKCAKVPEGPVRMRLHRQGYVFSTYWTIDGETWNLASRYTVPTRNTLWAGLLFKRVADDRKHAIGATFTVADLQAQSGWDGAFDVASWDCIETEGSAEILDESSITLSLDGTTLGEVKAFSRRRLAGDIDLVVRIDTPQIVHEPGTNRRLFLWLDAIDDTNSYYAGWNEHDTFPDRRWIAQVKTGGSWKDYHWKKHEELGGWMRLTRRNDVYRTYLWREGEWWELGSPHTGTTAPVYLALSVGNDESVQTPCPVEANFTIELLRTGEEVADDKVWIPPKPSVFRLAEVPNAMTSPDGSTITAWQSPFGLGRLFFKPDGTPQLLSSSKERAQLLRISADDLATTVVKSDVLVGINMKGACFDGEDVLVSIDGWHLGGNLLAGIFRMKLDGTFEQVELDISAGDLGDLVRDNRGRLLVSDFGSENIYSLSRGATKPVPLLEGEGRPAGPIEIACSRRGGIYFLNHSGDWPFGGKSAVYQVVGKNARILFEAAEGTTVVGMDVSPGGCFAEGIYALLSNGQLIQIDRTGQVATVASGLQEGRQIRFAPRGDLWIVAGEEGKRLYRIRSDTEPQPLSSPVRPAMSKPSDAGPPAADLTSVSAAIGIEVMAPSAESLRHAGLEGGASVTRVAKRSVAERVGIKAGMILYLVNDKKVLSPEHLDRALNAQRANGSATLRATSVNSSFGFTVPLPLHGQRYTQPQRAFSLPIPDGWFLFPNHRNIAADDKFDTLASRDGKHVIIIARNGVPVADPVKDLAQYETEKSTGARRFQVSGLERIQIGGVPAFRVYYHVPKGAFVVSRMSFVHGMARYVINVVSYETAEKDLPDPIKKAIDGLQLGQAVEATSVQPRPLPLPQGGLQPLQPPASQLFTTNELGRHVLLGVSAVSAGRPEAHRLGIETPTGAVISEVFRNSSAHLAGLRTRDVIVQFADREINCFADLEAITNKSQPDSTQVVTLVRGLKRLTIRWKLGSGEGITKKWYVHPSGGFQMRIPLHWKTVLASGPRSSTSPQTTLDEIASRDAEYRLFCVPQIETPANLDEALRDRVASQLRKTPAAKAIAANIANERLRGTAVLVKGSRVYWHYQFAVTLNGRLYAFHLYADPFSDGETIPEAVLGILNSMQEYRPVPK